MKKLVKLAVILLVVVCLVGCNKKEKCKATADEHKFMEEYESLNGKKIVLEKLIKKLNIGEETNIKYVDDEGVIKFLQEGTGVIYFGYPECPWCRQALPIFLDVSKEYTPCEILYYNALDIRDEKELDNDGNVVTKTEGTDNYKKILELLGDKADTYEGLNDESIKRLYFPTMVFVKDGVVIGTHMATVDSQTDPYKSLTTKEINKLKDIYKGLFDQVKAELCVKKSMLDVKDIERSLITKYRKTIWRKFTKAVRDYNLIEENDTIAVCISGGKDSFLLAKCIEELKRHGQVNFSVKYLVMDPGYTPETIAKIKENATILNLELDIFSSDIFRIVDKSGGSPCYLCARMRRGSLYKKARELGCNKIALGHHFNDVVETVLLSMLYGGEYKSMRPKLKSTNFKGMQLIRPLYLVKEEDIINFINYNKLEFINCACKFTEDIKKHQSKSKRLEMKNLIKDMKKNNPNVEYNIFSSSENVSLDTLLGYKKMIKNIIFLDDYE